MTTKIFSWIVVFMFVIGFVSVETTYAAEPSFPAGCSSALGYSVTTGLPCNGTSTATVGFLSGCTTAIGYSVATGTPCSGGPLAITYLSGCNSLVGYSTITGKPCNGTMIATTVLTPPIDTTTPGLPSTGAGGNAPLYMFILGSSALLFIVGLASFRRSKHS